MQFATKIQRKIYFAKRKASMFFISALACVGSIVPAAASEPALLSTDGDVETIKAVCRLWAKWGLLFLAVVAFFYFKTKGNVGGKCNLKGAPSGPLVTWVLAGYAGASLFMIFDFFKYLAGLIGG